MRRMEVKPKYQFPMKNFVLMIAALLVSCSALAQDTLFLKNRTKVNCRITEVNTDEIKYIPAGLTDGPVILINKNKVYRYTLSNGYTEVLTPDELSIENEHESILNNRRVIKIHPFSIMCNDITFAYESVIRVGMNLDIEAGYINSNLNEHPLIPNNVYNSGFYSGAFIKPGLKFFIGKDFSVKGLRYAHPLKGSYVKIDLVYSYVKHENLQEQSYWGSQMPVIHTSDLNAMSYGLLINFGRQIILGNMFTMDYYAGVGYTGVSARYTDPYFQSGGTNYGYYRGIPPAEQMVSYFNGFVRVPNVGISFTCGFRLGFILPEKKSTKPASTR
jgi:hypothetical protein